MSAQVLVILMAVASLLLNTELWVSEYKAILQRIYVNMVIIHSITQASMGHQIAARMLLFGFGDALTFHAALISILFPGLGDSQPSSDYFKKKSDSSTVRHLQPNCPLEWPQSELLGSGLVPALEASFG